MFRKILNLSTLIFPGENVVDLGAQWVHGQVGNVVFELTSKHDGLLSSDLVMHDPNKHEFITINGEIIPDEERNAALTIYGDNLGKMDEEEFKQERGSFGDYFIRE